MKKELFSLIIQMMYFVCCLSFTFIVAQVIMWHFEEVILWSVLLFFSMFFLGIFMLIDKTLMIKRFEYDVLGIRPLKTIPKRFLSHHQTMIPFLLIVLMIKLTFSISYNGNWSFYSMIVFSIVVVIVGGLLLPDWIQTLYLKKKRK